MECRQVRESLSAYIDGEVSQKEKSQVDEHLLTCENCTEALAELGASVARIRELEEVDPPPWLTRKVMARVKAESGKKKGFYQRFFHPFLLPRPIHALSAILVIVLSVYVFQTMKTSVRPAKAPIIKEKEAPLDERKSFPPAEQAKTGQETREEKPVTAASTVESKTESVMEPEVEEKFGSSVKAQEDEKIFMENRRVLDKTDDRLREAGPDTVGEEMGRAEAEAVPPVAAAKSKRAPGKVPAEKAAEIEADRHDRTYAVPSAALPDEDTALQAGAALKRDLKPMARGMKKQAATRERGVRLVILVKNPEIAGEEVEKLLAESGATLVKKDFIYDNEPLFLATVRREHFSELKEKLTDIGVMKEETGKNGGETTGGEGVTIEIVLRKLNP